ncbi:quinoprotein dehydrogenase-associated SoxYZ-like carrier [Candidatus Methylopumilus turicensis]|uniref:Sulfur oxidation protein SoxZ n=1 Tax=Candidatus Methylopumilus turicensis TaxID=1581680 RepID=A0A0B7IZS7_9PROT|nr:quinoprotein dehydrogenase-associated SoxYZ-like carrier [Candidatus Methylopumilus turicensis]CEN56600.1 Sulfur oxidation protein SoxZ [Candidatus Methylopumilus turicensis]
MKNINLLLKLLFTGLAFISFSVQTHAESDPSKWPLVKEAFFAQRPMADAPFITFVAPRRAESGAQVPLEIAIDQTQADANAIKTLYLLVDSNPIPLTATYHLTDQLGKFKLATRIRMEMDSYIRAVGETADGKLYLASVEIRAAGGCGGTVDGDEAAIRASAGKIKMNVESPVKFGDATAATFIIKHPMRTGLQRDLVSQGFVPAFYIQKAAFTYNNVPVMDVDFGVGTSEDPYLRFNFIPKAPGVLEVKASDNDGKAFSHQTDVK